MLIWRTSVTIDYYAAKHGVLAERLDLAWSDYMDLSVSEAERMRALDFMIYVFDIKRFSNEKDSLNEVLLELMVERANKKENNPLYIPILATGKYQLENKAQILIQTRTTKKSPIPAVQDDFDAGNLLDVNHSDKFADVKYRLTYLTPQQRAKYRIEIVDGLFHHSGKTFDSSDLTAHDKLGYVAFTLNTNGELSVFEHLGGLVDKSRRKLAHSSMNAGSPVLAAGEMEIKNGKLISINSFSGHYQPSLYSIARFLEYLSNRGVDISQTKVFLQKKPAVESGLKSKVVSIRGDRVPWHEVRATELFYNVKVIMKSNMASIDEYLNSFGTQLRCNLFKLDTTLEKVKLGKQFQYEMNFLMGEIKNSASLHEIKASLDLLRRLIKTYVDENARMDIKSGRLGKRFLEMQREIQKVQDDIGDVDKVEITRETGFKKSY
jgi:hypothetical protein